MADDIAAAERLAKSIEAKAIATLAPLKREMTIMKWRDEYRAIMWEAVLAQVLKEMRVVGGQ